MSAHFPAGPLPLGPGPLTLWLSSRACTSVVFLAPWGADSSELLTWLSLWPKPLTIGESPAKKQWTLSGRWCCPLDPGLLTGAFSYWFFCNVSIFCSCSQGRSWSDISYSVIAGRENLLEVEIPIIGLLKFMSFLPHPPPQKYLRQFVVKYICTCHRNLKRRVKISKVQDSREGRGR